MALKIFQDPKKTEVKIMVISKKEYLRYLEYKKRESKGQILTPECLALICKSNGFEAEKIGKEILSIYARQQSEKSSVHKGNL